MPSLRRRFKLGNLIQMLSCLDKESLQYPGLEELFPKNLYAMQCVLQRRSRRRWSRLQHFIHVFSPLSQYTHVGYTCLHGAAVGAGEAEERKTDKAPVLMD